MQCSAARSAFSAISNPEIRLAPVVLVTLPGPIFPGVRLRIQEESPLHAAELFKGKSPDLGFFNLTLARAFPACLYHDKLPHHARVFMFQNVAVEHVR